MENRIAKIFSKLYRQPLQRTFCALWLLVALFVLVVSCANNKPPIAPAIENRDTLPIMTTYGVSKMISDSGVMRYKVVAEEWQVFDRTHPQVQKFNKGLLLEKFNQKFHIEMYMTADTAYWYNQELWELRGRVCLWNEDGMTFRTELLFWDMPKHVFYSDKYGHMTLPDKDVEGVGFRSNETLTQYEINCSHAVFPIPQNETEEDTMSTAIPSDSAKTKPAQGGTEKLNGAKQASQHHFKP